MLLALCSACPCASELDRCRLILERHRRQPGMDDFSPLASDFLFESHGYASFQSACTKSFEYLISPLRQICETEPTNGTEVREARYRLFRTKKKRAADA